MGPGPASGMDVVDIFQRLGVGAALGLLIGLQREHAGTNLAGIRTFPLVTISGGSCALFAMSYGGWLIGAGLVALVAVMMVGNLRPKEGEARDGAGITTEVAALVMFVLGAYLIQGALEIAVVIAGALA